MARLVQDSVVATMVAVSFAKLIYVVHGPLTKMNIGNDGDVVFKVS